VVDPEGLTTVRHLAIGDIHGCLTALKALERHVPFRPEDRIVTLGDYVDRGPDSRGVLDWLIERHGQGTLIPLIGNHELMMLSARHDPYALEAWLVSGGDAALASYGAPGVPGRIEDVPKEHWAFLEEETHPWHEIETHFFVHANAYADCPLEEQPDSVLYWERFDGQPPHESGKVMVCGHTPQRSGRPLSIGHAICLDTAACRGGWLTCLDVKSGFYWQANQLGYTRAGII
jgi:serine/threonine protein phosphatase 1